LIEKSILVVDDDSMFLKSILDILEMYDYEICSASSGEAALKIMRDKHIDLLITDIVMPGLEGVALSEMAKANNPKLSIIAMTGGGRMASGLTEKLELNSHFAFVHKKPFSFTDLLESIDKVFMNHEEKSVDLD